MEFYIVTCIQLPIKQLKTMREIKDALKVFQNKEKYFSEDQGGDSRKIIGQLVVITALTFLYGIVMGSYHSFLQAISSGIKVSLLFFITLIICFPSFFVIQQVLGSKLSIRQMIKVVLSGFVLTSALALSFTPIIIFFQLTGGNYHFLQLLHVAVFVFSGIFGMRLMIEALKHACEKQNIYPKIGVTVFKVWIVILGFVGIQLAWNLRPFLSERDEEFKVFREYEGNFYTAIIYSIQQIGAKEEMETKIPRSIPGIVPVDTLHHQINEPVDKLEIPED